MYRDEYFVLVGIKMKESRRERVLFLPKYYQHLVEEGHIQFADGVYTLTEKGREAVKEFEAKRGWTVMNEDHVAVFPYEVEVRQEEWQAFFDWINKRGIASMSCFGREEFEYGPGRKVRFRDENTAVECRLRFG